MRKVRTLGIATIAVIALAAWETKQQKTYTLTLTAQETQVVFDALGELPAKTSESIRAKIAQQVTSQNQTSDKK